MKECFCCPNVATKDGLCDRCHEMTHQSDKAFWVEMIPSKSKSQSAGSKGKIHTLGKVRWVSVVEEAGQGVVYVKDNEGVEHRARKEDLHTEPDVVRDKVAFIAWVNNENPNYWEKRYARDGE